MGRLVEDAVQDDRWMTALKSSVPPPCGSDD